MQNLKILFLEDNKELSRMMESYFSINLTGSEVKSVGTLKAFREMNVDDFTIFILDIRLPDGELEDLDFQRLPDKALKIVVTGDYDYVQKKAKEISRKYKVFVLTKIQSVSDSYFKRILSTIKLYFPLHQLVY